MGLAIGVVGLIISIVTIIVIIAVGAGIFAIFSATEQFNPRVVGYWANWTTWLGFSETDLHSLKGCTDCMYSFITLAAENNAEDPTREPWDGANLYTNTFPLFKTKDYEDSLNPPLETEGSDGQMGSITQIKQFVQNVHENRKKAHLAIGGWSDTQNTPKFRTDITLAPKLANMFKTLVEDTGADGIDFDWEHLGGWYFGPGYTGPQDQPTIEDKVDRCLFMGYLMRLMHQIGVKSSYTSRSNTFVPYQYMASTGYVQGSSDCEGVPVSLGGEYSGSMKDTEAINKFYAYGLEEFNKSYSPDYQIPPFFPKYEYLAMMTYDGAVGIIANSNPLSEYGADPVLYNIPDPSTRNAIHNQYSFEDFQRVVLDTQRVGRLKNSQVLPGFEPFVQVAGGIPADEETVDKVITWIREEYRGGIILWAVNDNRSDGAQGRAAAAIAEKAFPLFSRRSLPSKMTYVKPYAYARDWGWGPGTECVEFSPYNYEPGKGIFWNPLCMD
jgi:hypothetical protein